MDSVLEKITLYDILGYLLPGSVLMLLVSYGADQTGMNMDLSWWSGSEGFEYFVFFLVSYLAGIVLSEIMTLVWNVCDWILSILPKKIRENVHYFIDKIVSFIKRKENRSKLIDVWSEEIKEALIKSGVKNVDNKFKESNGQKTLEKDCMRYMYGCIQGIETYKRIHNYASAYVLYKNVAGALLIGLFFTRYFCGVDDQWFCALCFIMGLIFVCRGIRFRIKKRNYTVIWFLEEFNLKKDTTQKNVF